MESRKKSLPSLRENDLTTELFTMQWGLFGYHKVWAGPGTPQASLDAPCLEYYSGENLILVAALSRIGVFELQTPTKS